MRDLDELDRLHAAATPGPWVDATNKIGAGGGGIDADRVLVIALRNAWPEISRELRALRAMRDGVL